MTIHSSDCDCDLYGCQLRRKAINLSAAVSPTMRARTPFRPKVNCSWEAGKAGETRADGSFMPYLDGEGRTIGVKEYGERRREFSKIRRQLAQGPAPQE